MAWIATIAAALIGAASQADASSTAAGGEAAAAQNAKNKAGSGNEFTPSAEKFAPGISGTGDGSMPVKADKPGEIFSQKPEVATAPIGISQQAPMDTGSQSSPTQQAAAQPSPTSQTTPPPTNTNDYAAWAQTGLGLAQALQGQPAPPMQPAQVGGAGYQPTALQMLQMMAQKKKQMGY